ncbi:hypothetical protein GDO86_001657 [Hymenochirus boettgeri]|uniref:Taste receptor type 2 n=1 Tax=Hymenochirus boettgeri TaxID=247094 RepID=A0A8T2KLV7_9PIPI|nr:hypothetical protein GDO86_001657 [Hymenochirus boettgeri]
MLPIFILASLAILGVTTLMGIVTNTIIVAVNLVDKVMGKSLNPSDVIFITLGLSNVIFQFTITVNDFMAIIQSDLYYSDAVYGVLNTLMILPIFSSFWFTVCLCVYYCLQILIFTHPFLVRLKLGIPQLVPFLLVTAVFISVALTIPILWSIYRDPPSANSSGNSSLETGLPKLSLPYLFSSSLFGCSLPLVLVGISIFLILNSLITKRAMTEKTRTEVYSPRTEARVRAVRTLSCLLLLYTCFYISEILMFVDFFPQISPGLCICLIVIYIYSPAQSVILIFGSPKLKKAFLNILQLPMKCCSEKTNISKILVIKLQETTG